MSQSNRWYLEAISRRTLLRSALAGSSLLLIRQGLAQDGTTTAGATPTPNMTEGPYYPDRFPLDTDNDLVIVNGSTTVAAGEVTYLSGRVLDTQREPIRNATVEIWQVDHGGAYLNTRDPRHTHFDADFQGYGRTLTDAAGRYGFRTIKPVPYPGRAPHIHMAINLNGARVLTTQILIQDHPQNARDGVLRSVRDPAARASVQVPFTPIPGSPIGALAAEFDVILGATPELPDEPIQGAVAPAQGDGFGGPGGPGRPPRGERPRGGRGF